MTLTLDHIVIHVRDLQVAMQTYQSAGFTVNYGGQHADGVTENALIILSDGAYIELIALVEGKTYEDAGFKPLLKDIGEGFTGYALQSDDIETDLAEMQKRGVEVGEIREGSRERPDGELLKWKMAVIDNAMTPFVLQDVTDRELRVPTDETFTVHENGATGVRELLIRTDSFADSIDRFGRIIRTPLLYKDAARFEVGRSAVVLTSAPPSIGSMIPALLTLYTDETSPVPHTLHGADFLFI